MAAETHSQIQPSTPGTSRDPTPLHFHTALARAKDPASLVAELRSDISKLGVSTRLDIMNALYKLSEDEKSRSRANSVDSEALDALSPDSRSSPAQPLESSPMSHHGQSQPSSSLAGPLQKAVLKMLLLPGSVVGSLTSTPSTVSRTRTPSGSFTDLTSLEKVQTKETLPPATTSTAATNPPSSTSPKIPSTNPPVVTTTTSNPSTSSTTTTTIPTSSSSRTFPCEGPRIAIPTRTAYLAESFPIVLAPRMELKKEELEYTTKQTTHKRRVFFTEEQREKLNDFYDRHLGMKHTPNEIASIACQVGITDHQVRIYFQNKRARQRDRTRPHSEDDGKRHSSPETHDRHRIDYPPSSSSKPSVGEGTSSRSSWTDLSARTRTGAPASGTHDAMEGIATSERERMSSSTSSEASEATSRTFETRPRFRNDHRPELPTPSFFSGTPSRPPETERRLRRDVEMRQSRRGEPRLGVPESEIVDLDAADQALEARSRPRSLGIPLSSAPLSAYMHAHSFPPAPGVFSNSFRFANTSSSASRPTFNHPRTSIFSNTTGAIFPRPNLPELRQVQRQWRGG